ncbi:hypothetical protein AB1Y20_019796 [Prymnesium parvum]|uniref:glycerol kinase n=1 Tax=Prymnesium parvum TaxID=97485 RepID=A0AB34JVH4_PRYPA
MPAPTPLRLLPLLLSLPSLAATPRLVLAVDVGTESTRAALFDGTGALLSSSSHPHATTYPSPGWAEQHPSDWWEGLGAAARGALAAAAVGAEACCAVCVCTTSCTVLACDAEGAPLRPALLWMDSRAAAQAARILAEARGDAALAVHCGGDGPISAEWMLPKALWLKECEPSTWAAAAVVCECQDWLNLQCTGELVAGGCNVATRWNCDGAEAVARAAAPFGGRPTSLLRKVGLADLAERWPRRCVGMGEVIGGLTPAAAAHLGLRAGTPVVQGGADAFVGLVGLGAASTPGAVGLITGSSHLHLAVVDAASPATARGVWGAYRGAPLPHLAMAEGGQSSTGAALQWARRVFSGAQTPSLRELDEEAAVLPVGAEGVTALETFQGSRTPLTDPNARGALIGLSLGHSRAHVWRALLEAICMGTRASLDALHAATGAPAEVLLVAGGATRSPFWLQMHADVAGVPVQVGKCADAPLLGGAILAAAAAGIHADIRTATEAMVHAALRLEPRADVAAQYQTLYRQVYQHMAPTLASLSHRVASGAPPPRWAPRPSRPPLRRLPSGRKALVLPSLLAADAGALSAAARDAAAAGARWVHVDVADGSPTAARALSSMGPATVAAIRAAAPSLLVDVHLAVSDPLAHIAAFAEAGAHRICFQFEAAIGPEYDTSTDAPLADVPARALAQAKVIAAAIAEAGCAAGVCIAPATPISAVAELVDSRAVDLVDVLAVYPGRGGQSFQPSSLDKLAMLRATHPELPYLMLDGGVDHSSAALAAAAGANVLVSGSYLFSEKAGGLFHALPLLERILLERGL